MKAIHKNSQKYKLYKLKLKWSIIEMSKRLMIPAILSGLLIMTAPLAGIAEPTDESIFAGEQVEQAEGVLDKGWAILKGAGNQAKGVYQSVVKVDERLARKDETIKVYKLELAKAHKEIAGLRQEEVKRVVVSDIRLASATQCLQEVTEFLETQVEGR
jgi:hypothetical protein